MGLQILLWTETKPDKKTNKKKTLKIDSNKYWYCEEIYKYAFFFFFFLELLTYVLVVPKNDLLKLPVFTKW